MPRPRGEKGKPIEQHIADGTYRERRHGAILALMPKLETVNPTKTPPSHLSNEAKREWRKWAPKLAESGILKEADIPMFCKLCEIEAELKLAEKQEREFDRQAQAEDPEWNINGLYRTSSGQILENPKIKLKNRLREMAKSLWIEFGGTPIARKHIAVEQKKKISEWDEFSAPAKKNG